MWTEALLFIVVFLTDSPPASWKRFFVFVSGNAHGAHLSFVQKLKRCGQTQVDTDEDCDYVLVFCPVVSRVGTDISEALSKAPEGKPLVLVVMHHTFEHECVVADSGRQVSDPRVHLAVDCLFYENHFLDCQRNDDAWSEVQKLLPITPLRGRFSDWFQKRLIIGFVVAVVVIVAIVMIVIFTR